MEELTIEKIKEIERNELFYINNWEDISSDYILPESFIERYQDKVFWPWISSHQKLSEDFIEKFQDKLNLIYISRYQTLSESFIKKYIEKLPIYIICAYQKLSEFFIKDNILFFDEMSIKNILRYQKHLSLELKNQLKITSKLL